MRLCLACSPARAARALDGWRCDARFCVGALTAGDVTRAGEGRRGRPTASVLRVAGRVKGEPPLAVLRTLDPATDSRRLKGMV